MNKIEIAIRALLAIFAIAPLGAIIIMGAVFISTWSVLWILGLLIFFTITIRLRDWAYARVDRMQNITIRDTLYLIGGLFLIADWYTQRTLFSALFLDWDLKHNLVTDRLIYYQESSDYRYTWRGALAHWFCLYPISWGDPTHCVRGLK